MNERVGRRLSRLVAIGVLVSTSVAAGAVSATAHASTVAGFGGASSSDWYSTLPDLTPGAVSSGFGEQFDLNLPTPAGATGPAGQVYAQPLVDDAVGAHGIVLVATEGDDVYGVDSTTGHVVWSRNLGTPATPLSEVAPQIPYPPCTDIGSEIGVTSTPVIDPATNVAYLVNAEDVSGTTQYFMQAINMADGTTATGWPSGGQQIQATAQDGITAFTAGNQTQRPGLVLVNGDVYAAFSSQCDYWPATGYYSGWVIGVSTSTHDVNAAWASQLDYSNGSGIWQSGGAPVVDAQGDIYVTTGNNITAPGQATPYPTPGPGTTHAPPFYSDSLVKLSTAGGGLTPVDWFMPANNSVLDAEDLDLSSGGPVQLPASMTTSQEPNLIAVAGKEGVFYLVNEDGLGGYQDGSSSVGGVPSATGGDNVASELDLDGSVYGHAAAWPGDGGYLYLPVYDTGYPGANTGAHSGTLVALQRVVSSSGAVSFRYAGDTGDNSEGFGSGSAIVTSNGTATGSGLVWQITHASSDGSGAVLEAFDPVPQTPGDTGTLKSVWTSPTFDAEKYTVPGVGDDQLFVGTQDGQLLGFGFTSPQSTVGADNADVTATPVGQSSTTSVSVVASAATTIESVAVSGPFSSSFAGPVTLNAGDTLSVPLTFTPTQLGTSTGSLTINTLTGSTPGTTRVDLSAQGLPDVADVSASPTSLDFGTVAIGSAASAQSVTFTNNLATPVTIDAVSGPLASSPFTVTGQPTDGSTLAPGGTVTMEVTFTPPGTSGDYDHVYGAVLALATSDGDYGIPLSAIAATPATLTEVPSQLDFGSVALGASSTLDLRLGDNGGTPLTLTSVSDASASGFSLVAPIPSGLVVPGNSQVVYQATFRPTALGPMTTTWTFDSTATNGPVSVTLSGVGVATTPSAPQTVIATGFYRGADVTWSAPSTDGGDPVLDYVVTATDLTTNSSGVAHCVTTSTRCTLTGLTATDRYDVTVVATNSQGDSPPALSNVVTTSAATLRVVSVRGRAGVPLTLQAAGDPLGGPVAWYAVNGTARGCRVHQGALSADDGGTCVVVAVAAASSREPVVQSSATVVTMTGTPGPAASVEVTLSFASGSATLTPADHAVLAALSRALTGDRHIVIDGVASTRSLAMARATATRLGLGTGLAPRVVLVARVASANVAVVFAHH